MIPRNFGLLSSIFTAIFFYSFYLNPSLYVPLVHILLSRSSNLKIVASIFITIHTLLPADFVIFSTQPNHLQNENNRNEKTTRESPIKLVHRAAASSIAA